MRPVIGITPDVGHTAPRPGRPATPFYELKIAYADAVLAAGGLPLILPYSEDATEVIDLCDGVVITGGAFDIPPEMYGAERSPRLGTVKEARTAFEQRILRAALQADLPVLGICGGMQLLGVEAGGTLYQDIPGHEQEHDPREPDHPVRIAEGSELHRIVGLRELQVNS